MSLFFHRGRWFICLLEEKHAALLLYFSDLSVNEVTAQAFVQHSSCMTAAGHRGQSQPLLSSTRPGQYHETPWRASGCHLLPCGAERNEPPVKTLGGNRCPPKVLRGPFFNLMRSIQPPSSAGSPENGVSSWRFSGLHTMALLLLSLSATPFPYIIYRL